MSPLQECLFHPIQTVNNQQTTHNHECMRTPIQHLYTTHSAQQRVRSHTNSNDSQSQNLSSTKYEVTSNASAGINVDSTGGIIVNKRVPRGRKQDTADHYLVPPPAGRPPGSPSPSSHSRPAAGHPNGELRFRIIVDNVHTWLGDGCGLNTADGAW